MSWPHWLHTADVSANNRVVCIGPMHGKDREKGEKVRLLQAREPSWCFQKNSRGVFIRSESQLLLRHHN